jgi:hypothetical protein
MGKGLGVGLGTSRVSLLTMTTFVYPLSVFCIVVFDLIKERFFQLYIQVYFQAADSSDVGIIQKRGELTPWDSVG